jgi:hypothetical protein
MAVVAVCAAASAQAQSFNFTGLATGHLGVSATNDVRGGAATPGASMAVLDDNGVGMEIDLGHLNDFDSRVFERSSITSVMLNLLAMTGHPTLRPFVVAGVGVMRVSATVAEGLPSVGRTEPGWNAGGGALYMVNEAVGVRGDARYFRHFSRHADLPLAGDGVLDFWRLSVGITLAWPIR